jgi:uncharacterized protein (TIGR03437 family)
LPSEPELAKYGFQLSPRLSSAVATASGGSLQADSLGIFVQCADGNPVPAGGCPERAPLYFAQHRRPSLEPVWELDWTPPKDATGPIELFLALNAANGLGDQSGDRIFLNSVVVQPAGPLTFRQPFGGGGASPDAWLEIFGAGLSGATAVTVGGRSAAIEYASASQMNVRIAPDAALGWHTAVVNWADGRSVESPIYLTAASPSLFPSLPQVAVGETAVLYGTGCGHRNEPARAEIRMNHRSYPGMAYASPGLAGLCQVQFVVPEIEPGPYLVHVCIEGTCNGQRLRLQVRQSEGQPGTLPVSVPLFSEFPAPYFWWAGLALAR